MIVSNGATAVEQMKEDARRAARERRRGAFHALGPRAAAVLPEMFAAHICLARDAIVAGYTAMRDEIDPSPLLERLAAEGHPIALPRVDAQSRSLAFHRWSKGMVLVPGAYGIGEPPIEAEGLRPDIVLVPLLAFERRGYRLGYGGGYYDRTLAELRGLGSVVAVGLAFSAQEADTVPHGPHDQPLDWILTEREAIDTRKVRL